MSAAAEAPRRRGGLLRSLLPEGGVFPWWVILLVSIYLLLKLGMSLEHPCGVLGTVSPVTRAQIAKSYRTISVCTHPDKLRGRDAADAARGETLFKRASVARDQLMGELRTQAAADAAALAARGVTLGEGEEPAAPTASCSTQLDSFIYSGLAMLWQLARETGVRSMCEAVVNFIYQLITLEFGITTTISLLLVMLTLSKTLMSLVAFVGRNGPLTTVLSIPAALLVAPMPSVALFCALPPMRILTFTRHELWPEGGKEVGASGDETALADGDDLTEHKEEPPSATASTAAAGAAAAASGGAGAGAGGGAGGGGGGGGARAASSSAPSRELPVRTLKQRKGAKGTPPRSPPPPPPPLNGAAAFAGSAPLAHSFGGLDGISGAWRVLARRPMAGYRGFGAASIQFDLLLSLTKPVIPLICLVATGQVYP